MPPKTPDRRQLRLFADPPAVRPLILLPTTADRAARQRAERARAVKACFGWWSGRRF